MGKIGRRRFTQVGLVGLGLLQSSRETFGAAPPVVAGATEIGFEFTGLSLFHMNMSGNKLDSLDLHLIKAPGHDLRLALDLDHLAPGSTIADVTTLGPDGRHFGIWEIKADMAVSGQVLQSLTSPPPSSIRCPGSTAANWSSLDRLPSVMALTGKNVEVKENESYTLHIAHGSVSCLMPHNVGARSRTYQAGPQNAPVLNQVLSDRVRWTVAPQNPNVGITIQSGNKTIKVFAGEPGSTQVWIANLPNSTGALNASKKLSHFQHLFDKLKDKGTAYVPEYVTECREADVKSLDNDGPSPPLARADIGTMYCPPGRCGH
jgi:hypothetical protein